MIIEKKMDLAIEHPDGSISYMMGNYDEFMELCKKDPSRNFVRPDFGKPIRKIREFENNN